MDAISTRQLQKIGLTYVSDSEPGIIRHRRGRGFFYRMPDGTSVTDEAERLRLKSLGVPPAYTKVWICVDPCGHLQATGYDARGRKQYRYHPDWQALRGENKFGQLGMFCDVLPAIRSKAAADIRKQRDNERVTLAALVLLLDAAFLRVGNMAYLRSNGTYGATTLLKRHVSFGEALELKFAAKGGRKVHRTLKQPRLQRILEKIADLPGRALFVWQDEQGHVHPVDSSSLNNYLATIAGVSVSAKTFRTWGGTLAAFRQALLNVEQGEKPTLKGMCEAAANELCNTPAICRKSYIHPDVLALASDEASMKRLAKVMAKAPEPVAGLRKEEIVLRAYLGA